MPAPYRPEPVAVVRRLLEEPHGFGFFQAVRLLERWWAREEGLTREQVLAQRIGFCNSLSLAFPPSEIESLRATWAQAKAAADGEAQPDVAPAQADEGPPQHVALTPAFMSLLGAGGALPVGYTEWLQDREAQQRNSAARAFLDMFLHRMVALFYLAWRKHRLAVQLEDDRQHAAMLPVLSLAGLGPAALRHRLRPEEGGVSDHTLAHWAGTLQRRPLSAHSLQKVLGAYFGTPVKIEQFIGRWFELPQHSRNLLGLANVSLGYSDAQHGPPPNAVLGERVWQRDLRVRLVLGPLTPAQFERMLPGQPGALAVRELLSLLAGPTLEFEVRLALAGEDIPPPDLDRHAIHLGWNSFLIAGGERATRCDAGYDLLAVA